jgi:hypothetical protein
VALKNKLKLSVVYVIISLIITWLAALPEVDATTAGARPKQSRIQVTNVDNVRKVRKDDRA